MGTASPFLPRTGDLAADPGRGGRIGIITSLPSAECAHYRLRSPAGDEEWTAPADGTTLTPVPAKPTHATLATGPEPVYDRQASQASMPIVVHFEDGTTAEATAILTPAEMERLYAQAGRLLADHDARWGKP
ncbi:hypothetical protein [Streptomyces sp. AN091965]|uniref:hypothetical protein n=1 Tax=Streptomyces sp. AN091965 TaxID=2927803 RepID=UPI001F6152BB|nr:hypothetical protein [Streptomyces sp. AN091965]MCI3932110.1 hypothetical protein [Streptomyces sp. AN091965]